MQNVGATSGSPEARFTALFGPKGAPDRLAAIRRYGHAHHGVVADSFPTRLSAALDEAERLLSQSWWGPYSARELTLLFRAGRSAGGRRTGARSWRRLVASTAGYAAMDNPSPNELGRQLRQEIDRRLGDVVALSEPDRYLADFEDVYRDLVLAIAYRRADAAAPRLELGIQDLAKELSVVSLNHLGDVAEEYTRRRADERPVGLPVPECEPGSPLKSWVSSTVSRRISSELASRDGCSMDPESVFVRRELRRASRLELDDALVRLPPGEAEVFALDRILRPHEVRQETSKGTRDGRDGIIADLLGISPGAVHTRRSRYRRRLEGPESNLDRSDRGAENHE